MTTLPPPSDRTRVRRLVDRAAYDQATIHAILDAGVVAHVGIVDGTTPVVIPMAYARVGDAIVLHGSAKSRLIMQLGGGAEACVTVTHLDGFVMARLGIKWPTALMLLIGAVAVAAFGLGRETLDGWQWATILTGFFTNAAISGYYAAFARGFPAYARATGTGFVLDIGRLGAAGSPIIAGALFTLLGNSELLTVSVIMAMGSVISLLLFLMLPEREGDEVVATAAKS